MVGTKDMAKLIRHVREAKDARLDSSRAMRSSSSPSTPEARSSSSSDILGEKRLTNIRRQSLPWQRDAVAAIERGDAQEALKAFIENKCFHLAETREQAMAKLIEQWKKDGGIEKPESVFLLASTNAEVTDINREAQAARIQAGVVSAEKKVFANGVFLHEGDRVLVPQEVEGALPSTTGTWRPLLESMSRAGKSPCGLMPRAGKSRSISPDIPRRIWPSAMPPRPTRPKARQFPTSTS